MAAESVYEAATSYEVELGTGGVRKAGHYVSADFLPKLNGRQGAKVYKEMSLNDALIHGIVLAWKMMARRVKYRIDPIDDSAAAAKAQEWAHKAFFEQMVTPFSEVQAAAASKFVHGFAPCELVLHQLEDGTIGPKKISLRSQDTVDEWDFDEKSNDLKGLWQQTYDRPRVYLPMQKVLLFRTTSEGDNPEGQSPLRGSYKYYSRKLAIEEAEGRSALRSAGIVKIKIPKKYLSKDASANDKAMLSLYEEWAKKIAEDRAGYVFVPSDVDPETKQPLMDVEFLVADGRRGTDMSPLVERMDARIATSMLAQFILLGQQEVGARSLSEDHHDLFKVALSAFTAMDCAEIDTKVLKLVWALNGFDPKVRPKLAYEDIDMPTLEALTQFLSVVIPTGYPMSHELNLYLAKRAGLPEPPEVAMPKPGEGPGEKPGSKPNANDDE